MKIIFGSNSEYHFAGAGKMIGVFHDAGYKGLYGGLGGDAIKARKNIRPAKKQAIMQRYLQEGQTT